MSPTPVTAHAGAPSTAPLHPVPADRPRRRPVRACSLRLLPSRVVLFVVMFARRASVRYDGLLLPARSSSTCSSTTPSCSSLAVGMTFVILTGGIDLSVGLGGRAVRDARGDAAAATGWSAGAGDARSCCSSAPALGLGHGLIDPLLRHPAVHRHAGRDVPRPRALLRDQHRVDPDHATRCSPRSPRRTIPLPGDTFVSPSRASSRSLVVLVAAYVLHAHPLRPRRSTPSAATSSRRC